MTKLNIKDKIEMMLNDEVLTGTITGISTRETDQEFWEYYNVELQQKGWSLTFSHVTEKEVKND